MHTARDAEISHTDPCVNNEDCPHCNILSSEQKLQLSTPSYQKKSKKCEQKSGMAEKPTRSETSVEDDSTLVDPSLVSVFGVAASDEKAVKSPERTSSKEKSKKKHSSMKKLSTDAKLEAMDQKWSERFSRLEALLLSKSLEKPSLEPTFQTVKMPVKTPPASAIKVTEPFLAPKPADQPVDRPAVSTNQVQCHRPQAAELQPTDQPSTDKTPAVSFLAPGTSGLQTTKNSDVDMDSDSYGVPVRRPPSGFEEERELSDLDHNLTATETDQALSEEQSYHETACGIRSFMGWTHILGMDNSSSADDNPFTAATGQ